MLMTQLEAVVGNRAEMVDAINEFAEPGPRRAAWAVRCNCHHMPPCVTLRERCPNSLHSSGRPAAYPTRVPSNPLVPGDPLDHAAERVELSALEESRAAQLAKEAPPAEQVSVAPSMSMIMARSSCLRTELKDRWRHRVYLPLAGGICDAQGIGGLYLCAC